VHGSSFRLAQFNPCKGQPTRFAPFLNAAGACVPTLYAATSRKAAVFGSIFHDIELRHTFKNRLRKTSASEEEIDAIIGHASCLVA
jgi:hypothetical protein